MRRHLAKPTKRPIANHTRQAFDEMQDWLAANSGPLILDACCGVGDSSRELARQFPDHRIVGVDKSIKRLSTERQIEAPPNMILLRADLNDFYRLVVEVGLQFDKHFILYPNPWPKAAHLSRRWHGSAVFADIVRISGQLELRSNWKLYLEEFQLALAVASIEGELQPFAPAKPLTPFEAKYHASGQKLWQLTATI